MAGKFDNIRELDPLVLSQSLRLMASNLRYAGIPSENSALKNMQMVDCDELSEFLNAVADNIQVADNIKEAFKYKKYKLRTIAEALREEADILRDGGLKISNIRIGAASMLYHADKIDEAIAEMDELLEGKGE